MHGSGSVSHDNDFTADDMTRCPDCCTDVWNWQWSEHRTLGNGYFACPVLNGSDEPTTHAVNLKR